MADRLADRFSGAGLKAEVALQQHSRLELVEDKTGRKEDFKEAPWNNYFYVDVWLDGNQQTSNVQTGRGTAFLTTCDRVESGKTYATFLTAGHTLFGADRVVLRHSSAMTRVMKRQTTAGPFIELNKTNKSRGWFDLCSKFTDKERDTTQLSDYGAIFVEKKYLTETMQQHGVPQARGLEVHDVRHDPLAWRLPDDLPVFVAGYPKYCNGTLCVDLAAHEGKFRRRESLPEHFISDTASGRPVPLPATDVYTADTDEGVSGSPVIWGEFPRRPAAENAQVRWKAIAIHVGGFTVDGCKSNGG